MLPVPFAGGKPFYRCFCGLTIVTANLYNAGLLQSAWRWP